MESVLLSKSIVFGNSHRYEEAITVDDEIIHKFSESLDLTKQRSVAEGSIR